jgi:hypothetical protein
MNAVNLDDVSRCPLGVRCESCGVERDDLQVCTFELDRIGVACLTMCPRCAGSEVVPPVSVGTAVRLVAQHCEHLGVDLDEMAAILDGVADDPAPKPDEATRVDDLFVPKQPDRCSVLLVGPGRRQ